MNRICSGVKVQWVGAGGGIREYTGTVALFLPAGESLMDWECNKNIGWVSASFVDYSRSDRYIVDCKEGHRAVSASLLERQNPSAAKEPV